MSSKGQEKIAKQIQRSLRSKRSGPDARNGRRRGGAFEKRKKKTEIRGEVKRDTSHSRARTLVRGLEGTLPAEQQRHKEGENPDSSEGAHE